MTDEQRQHPMIQPPSEAGDSAAGEFLETVADMGVDLLAEAPILDGALEAAASASGAIAEVAGETVTAATESVVDIVGSLFDSL